MNNKITNGEIYEFCLSFGLNGQETEKFHSAMQDILLADRPKLESYLHIASFLKCELIS